jgi:hypothetical protein
MSNNQKAVKYNPSNSKNDIRVALLRSQWKVFAKSQKKTFFNICDQNTGPEPQSLHAPGPGTGYFLVIKAGQGQVIAV